MDDPVTDDPVAEALAALQRNRDRLNASPKFRRRGGPRPARAGEAQPAGLFSRWTLARELGVDALKLAARTHPLATAGVALAAGAVLAGGVRLAGGAGRRMIPGAVAPLLFRLALPYVVRALTQGSAPRAARPAQPARTRSDSHGPDDRFQPSDQPAPDPRAARAGPPVGTPRAA